MSGKTEVANKGEKLRFENISKSFNTADGNDFQVLDNISFDIGESEFVSVMGPSGCGKSTLLNIISGLVPPDSGTIRLGNTEISPGELSFGYVFQEPRLLNWRTCRENIRFALKGHGIPEHKHDDRIERWLTKVGLSDDIDNYPLRLSGGMRQRVGLARALAVNPDLLLMDEPFSSLDEVTARKMRSDLLNLWQETNKKVIFVTHDIKEAVLLSDSILFMNNHGEIFDEVTIAHSRPRDFDDPEIVKTEAKLTEKFFNELE